MSINKEELTEISKHLIILMKDFERVSNSQLENTHKSAEYLNQTITDNNQKTREMIGETGKEIQKQAMKAIGSVTEEKFGALEQRVHQLCNTIDHTTNRIDNSSIHVAKQTKVMGWTTFIMIVSACVAIVISTIWYVSTMQEELKQISAAYDRLEYNIDIKNAMNNVDLRTCDGKACIKIDETSKRWGEKGEFILVE